MISVRGGGSRVRNGKKGMEVGFRNGDMEENELEEGEAPLDSTIDPDIALSYLVSYFLFLLLSLNDLLLRDQWY